MFPNDIATHFEAWLFGFQHKRSGPLIVPFLGDIMLTVEERMTITRSMSGLTTTMRK